MFSLHYIALFAFLFVATTQAAPTKNKPIHCSPVGKPTKLVSFVPEKNHPVYYSIDHNADHPKLSGSKSSDEQFQFYHCSTPNDLYRKPKARRTSGQVRSVKHPDLCLTPNDVIKYIPHTSDASINFETIPRGRNGTISLKPCAQTDSETMRRQWFALEDIYPEDGIPNCKLRTLAQIGRKGDFSLFSLDGNSYGSSFYFPFRKGDAWAFLANDVPPSCRGKPFA